MKIVREDGSVIGLGELNLTEWRQLMADYFRFNKYASQAWDIIACVRGPDSPSETAEMNSVEHDRAYSGRRQRKRETVEILRHAMFFGVIGGAARHHKGDSVLVPNPRKHDHFDRHVVRAANALGIAVKYKD